MSKPHLFSIPNLYSLLILLISLSLAYLRYSHIKIENNIHYSDLFYDFFCNKYIYNSSGAYCYDKANLASGLLTGMANFSSEFKSSFVSLGLIHIIVASGSQISYLTTLVEKILIEFYIIKKLRFPLLVFCCLGLISYIGFSPPLIRGLVSYITIQLLTTYFGRFIHPIRALLFSFCVIILIYPFLLTSLSLYLSCIATFGLHINSRYFKEVSYHLILEQLIVYVLLLPLLTQFNSVFNLVSIPLNILIGIILPYLLFCLMFSFIDFAFPLIGHLLSISLDQFLLIILWIEHNSSFMNINITKFNFVSILTYYSIIGLIIISYDFFWIYKLNNKYH
jgi:ComEC/Rec2-related protein